MKHLHTSIALLCVIALMGCGSSTDKTTQGMDSQTAEQTQQLLYGAN